VRGDGSLLQPDTQVQYTASAFSDDYSYNPFVKKRRNSYEEEESELKNESHMTSVDGDKTKFHFANKDNDMTEIFRLMSTICDFGEFRKL